MIVFRTVDSDVLVLLLAFRHFAKKISSAVFCHFGSGDSACYYNKEICLNIGKGICHLLPFFFAFSGCDTLSAFFNQGKCKMWDRWLSYPTFLSYCALRSKKHYFTWNDKFSMMFFPLY